MQYTDHYNLNLPEGNDVVNPLVQDNPNYTAIDNALYANKLRVIGGASEVKTGNNHAITRSDSDIDIIRFTATSDWNSGDTMTIDGDAVTVYLPNSTSPQTGAYKINSEVLLILNGSRVTMFTFNTLTADDIEYAAGVSVKQAIDSKEHIFTQHAYTSLAAMVADLPADHIDLLNSHVEIPGGPFLGYDTYLGLGACFTELEYLPTSANDYAIVQHIIPLVNISLYTGADLFAGYHYQLTRYSNGTETIAVIHAPSDVTPVNLYY